MRILKSPIYKDEGNIAGIHARTIKPDGTIVDFDGKVFTKSVVKARGVKYLAKTFTLPAVQVGCILEYFYTVDLNEEYIFDSHWILSNELFTKAADFRLSPITSPDLHYGVRWTWQNMPPGAPQPRQARSCHPAASVQHSRLPDGRFHAAGK